MKKWLELELPAEAGWHDTVSAEMFALGCTGITEKEERLLAVFEDTDSRTLIEAVASRIRRYRPDFEARAIKINIIPAENWNENWKAHFKPFRLGKHVVVRPDWESATLREGDIELIITPKMAFGTGHHETTRLILRLLEAYDLENKKVLDAGTGSGILAIYAARRGAAGVTAFDNDPEAMENAAENGLINGVQNNIRWLTGDIGVVPAEAYDLIVANINRNVLLEIAGKLSAYAARGGTLILSGLLLTDEQTVLTAYRERGWRPCGREEEGEWLALKFKWQEGEK